MQTPWGSTAISTSTSTTRATSAARTTWHGSRGLDRPTRDGIADGGEGEGEASESRTVIVALAAILVLTALVIAAWRFGGDEAPRVQGVNAAAGKTETVTQQRIKLVIKAVRGATFMEVRAGAEQGAPLYTGTLERGQTQRFTKKALYVSVARPRNVILRVNGEPMRLPPSGRLTIAAATTVK